jgi:hypothetical protein
MDGGAAELGLPGFLFTTSSASYRSVRPAKEDESSNWAEGRCLFLYRAAVCM